MRDIVFVTGNRGKQLSAQKHLEEFDINVNSYHFNIIEPYYNDIEMIAKSKVIQAYQQVGIPCISHDSGFYIPNYPNHPNFPGAFPKRELLDKMGIDGLLHQMKDVTNRECYFRECLAFYDGTNVNLFYGQTDGTIAHQKRGIIQPGQWSDLWLIFIPEYSQKTLAEMTSEERTNRPCRHLSPFHQFAEWYKSYPSQILIKKPK